MAEYASPIVSLQIQKWEAAALVELGSLLGVEDDIRKLQSILSVISAVLEDGERRSTVNLALYDWLRAVKEAAFDADDVVDELQAEAERRKSLEADKNPVTTKVRDFFSSRNFILFRCRMARKIRARVRDFDKLAGERSAFHLTLADRNYPIETHSLTMESGVYGRDGEKEEVVDFLLNTGDDTCLSVLPIVGMGGIGKTTLAQLVYNDSRIYEHFDVWLWICVSKHFDVKDLIKEIVRSVTREGSVVYSLESLVPLLRLKLEEKRFLLVLDDVWNEDTSKWEMLKSLLRNDMSGNKIIVTTRSRTVADIMGTVTPLQLENLSDEESWRLFAEWAFGSRRESVNLKLVEIGKQIIRRCGGVPSALKAIGAILATKQSEQEWLAILNNINNSFRSQGWNVILAALGLSDQNLPTHLKQCIAYCKLFPYDYKIGRLQLTQAWIAEGFVQWTGEVLPPEDIANDYFNDFLYLSLFQDAGKDEYGNVGSCRMHDLIHDLAAYVARDDAITVERWTHVPPGCRYSSVLLRDNFSPLIQKVASEAKKLRSLLVFPEEQYPTHDVEVSDLNAISSLTYLRVLHLSNIGIKDIPRSMGRVRHLRYLNLSKNKITRLPDSILGKFKQLRFLDLSGNLITSLPKSITTLCHLESLNLQYCKQLQSCLTA